MNQNLKILNVGMVTALSVAFLAGCTGSSGGSSNQSSTGEGVSSNSQYIQAQMAITILNGSKTVYSDSTPNSSLVLQATQSYTLNLAVSNAPLGTSYSVVLTNISLVNSSPITLPVNVGPNSFTVPTQGQYTMKLVAAAAGYNAESKSYQAQVTCPNPTFTASSLNAGAITVSGSNNNYTYSAVGVTANANGLAPYTCAWDANGTGIVDTVFTSCDTPVANLYANYVLNRNVGLIVMDSCNTAYTITQPVSLAYTEPSPGSGINFIQGTLSNASGTAATDLSIKNVTYFAEDTATNKIVATQYGKGSFTIFAWQNYGMTSSVNFGMQIKVTGLVETTPINVGTLSGAVSAANAKISSVTYVTDEAGDQSPSHSLSGTNCTLTNQNAKVLFVEGAPCTGGKAGDQNNATVEVWGHYTCTGLTDIGGSTDVQGDFDGTYDIADSCSGGGGGGGGVPPPGF